MLVMNALDENRGSKFTTDYGYSCTDSTRDEKFLWLLIAYTNNWVKHHYG